MAHPVISLLTDFGLSSHYVAAMKGVILGICPHAAIIDISHEVPSFGIAEGAYLLAQAWRYFPTCTVHVAVVDPGVGSARRPILLETEGHRFIGPDNGIFSMLPLGVARHLTEERFFRHPVSRTFHGRDIFAPVAAHLAYGAESAAAGPVIQDPIRLHFHEPVRQSERHWTGTILHVDRFGNIITNFRGEEFSGIALKIGAATIANYETNYAASAPGELFLMVGSGGYWEISANLASAAELLGATSGGSVELALFPPQHAGISNP